MLNPAKFPQRLLYCPQCKDDRFMGGVSPKCPICNHNLVEILYIGSQRLTGATRRDEN